MVKRDSGRMRFLTDQDVYLVTTEFLKKQGYDVLRVVEAGLAGASDEKVLAWAYQNRYVLITRDKDFGALVFARRVRNAGVILLRMDPSTIADIHLELLSFLQVHTDLGFENYFCVVEPGVHRIRKIGI
jgi:predicted nuclease of predicted toxin-antitoxin system